MSFPSGLRPDRVQMWRICAINFLIFPLLCLLRPGVEPAEMVFKGVQFVQITLTFVCLSSCRWAYHVYRSGCALALLLGILPLTRLSDTGGA